MARRKPSPASGADATSETAGIGEPAAQPKRARRTSDEPVFELLRRVRAGDVEPRSLPARARIGLVELLMSEGATVAETAAALKVAERTIIRDRDKVRESWALHQDPGLTPRVLGALTQRYEQVFGVLWKTTKDQGVSAGVRARAARAAWRTTREYVQTLQSVGFVPTAELAVRASVTHSFGAAPELVREAELLVELAQQQKDEENAQFAARAEQVRLAAKRLPAPRTAPEPTPESDDDAEGEEES